MGAKPTEKIAAEPKNAEALRTLIEGAGINGATLGKICGVSRTTGNNYLDDPSKIPAEHWAKLAEAFNVSPYVFDDVVMRAGGIRSLVPELSDLHKDECGVTLPAIDFWTPPRSAEGEQDAEPPATPAPHSTKGFSAPAPYGTAGMLYAYTALPERERAYLSALAATMLKDATERGETEPRIARDYLAAVFECGPLHYDLQSAAEAAGITDEDASARPEEARAALIGQLPEVDRMAIAEMERDSLPRDASELKAVAEALREQEQQAQDATGATSGSKCDKAVES